MNTFTDKDLQRNRENGYSLKGLVQALSAQGKDTAGVTQRFEKAWAESDVELASARF